MASLSALEIGGAKRDRTVDLLHAMQALSQLSYSPISRTGRMLSVSPGAVNTIFPTYLFFMLEEQLLTLPFQHIQRLTTSNKAA